MSGEMLSELLAVCGLGMEKSGGASEVLLQEFRTPKFRCFAIPKNAVEIQKKTTIV